jgi:A/G-specific adenine glycosylase
VNTLPVKEKKINQKVRWLYYFIVEQNEKVFVRKRGVKDIWENLYEFILIETGESMDTHLLKKLPTFKKMMGQHAFSVESVSKVYSQKLTHQTIHGQFIRIQVKKSIAISGYTAVSSTELATLPFPKFITTYLKDKNVSLNLF